MFVVCLLSWGTNHGPNEVLFMRIHLVRILLLRQKQLLLEPPSSALYLADLSPTPVHICSNE